MRYYQRNVVKSTCVRNQAVNAQCVVCIHNSRAVFIRAITRAIADPPTISFVTAVLWRGPSYSCTKNQERKKKKEKRNEERKNHLPREKGGWTPANRFFATQTRRTLHLNPKMNSFYAMNYSKLAIRTRILFIVSHVTSTRVRNCNLGCECDWHVSC